MKKYTFSVLIIVLLLSHSVFAGANRLFLDKAGANYLHGLNSDHVSLVESTIHNVMAFKQQYPEYNFKPIIGKLTDLSLSSENSTVKLKAFLGLNYIKHTEWFGIYDFADPENQDLIFDDIVRKMAIRNKINFINMK